MSKIAKWLKKEQENSILTQVKNLKTQNPFETWDLFEEIGDGNFGTVYKVSYHFTPVRERDLVVPTHLLI